MTSSISPIKCARINLKSSKIAVIFSIILTLGMGWLVVLSLIPLSLSASLLCLLYRYWQEGKFRLPKPEGVIYLDNERFIKWQNQDYYLVRENSTYALVVTVLYLNSKRKIYIWRDSCTEADYRNLQVTLLQIKG